MKYTPLFFLWLLLFLPEVTFGTTLQDTVGRKKVFVFDIKADIDPRMNRQVTLALQEAEQKNADLIIIHMDTYGGAVNDTGCLQPAQI
jgi:membrane-bound serine protease (ClpP class)